MNNIKCDDIPMGSSVCKSPACLDKCGKCELNKHCPYCSMSGCPKYAVVEVQP